MDRFIDALMKKMTTEEKIGQLNLPVTGEITTGQAKSSDIAGKIKKGEVGGLFNLKGVEKIREVQKQAVEESRLGIPLLFGMDAVSYTHLNYGLQYQFRLTENFKLLAGGLIDANGGFVYNLRNTNNPASARAYVCLLYTSLHIPLEFCWSH